MLASTVQFSNNDQPPITPNQHGPSSLGPAPKDDHTAAPSDTQQRARPAPAGSRVPRSEEQY
jgi:hypothetical protein